MPAKSQRSQGRLSVYASVIFLDYRGNGAWRNGREHILLTLNESGGIEAGNLEAMPVGDCVGGASFHAVAAEDTAVVVDVVYLGVALAAGDTHSIGVFSGLDVDAVGGAGGGAEETGHTFFHAVDIALEDVDAAIPLFEPGRLVGVVIGDGRGHHLFEGDAHPLRNGGGSTQDFCDRIRHVSRSDCNVAPPGSPS